MALNLINNHQSLRRRRREKETTKQRIKKKKKKKQTKKTTTTTNAKRIREKKEERNKQREIKKQTSDERKKSEHTIYIGTCKYSSFSPISCADLLSHSRFRRTGAPTHTPFSKSKTNRQVNAKEKYACAATRFCSFL